MKSQDQIISDENIYQIIMQGVRCPQKGGLNSTKKVSPDGLNL